MTFIKMRTFMLFQIIRMLNSDEIACQEMLLLQTFSGEFFECVI